VNMPYFHVFVGFGFSVLHFGHLAIRDHSLFSLLNLNIYSLMFMLGSRVVWCSKSAFHWRAGHLKHY